MWFSLNLQPWFVPPIRFFSLRETSLVSVIAPPVEAPCLEVFKRCFKSMPRSWASLEVPVLGCPFLWQSKKVPVQVTVNEGVFSFVGCDDVFCFSFGWNGCHQEHMEELIYNGYLEVRCYLLSLFIFLPYFTCRCWKLSFLVNGPESLRPRMYNVTFLRTQHICRVLQGPGLFKGRGWFLGNPKDSVWEDWGSP